VSCCSTREQNSSPPMLISFVPNAPMQRPVNSTDPCRRTVRNCDYTTCAAAAVVQDRLEIEGPPFDDVTSASRATVPSFETTKLSTTRERGSSPRSVLERAPRRSGVEHSREEGPGKLRSFATPASRNTIVVGPTATRRRPPGRRQRRPGPSDIRFVERVLQRREEAARRCRLPPSVTPCTC
jgi:hypothetical protein